MHIICPPCKWWAVKGWQAQQKHEVQREGLWGDSSQGLRGQTLHFLATKEARTREMPSPSHGITETLHSMNNSTCGLDYASLWLNPNVQTLIELRSFAPILTEAKVYSLLSSMTLPQGFILFPHAISSNHLKITMLSREFLGTHNGFFVLCPGYVVGIILWKFMSVKRTLYKLTHVPS